MGIGDKISNKAEELKGAAQEKIGDIRGDESQQAEGAATQSEAKLKQSGEHAKDTLGDAKDAITGD